MTVLNRRTGVQLSPSTPSFAVEHDDWSSALSFKQVIVGSLPINGTKFGTVAKLEMHLPLKQDMRRFNPGPFHQHSEVAKRQGSCLLSNLCAGSNVGSGNHYVDIFADEHDRVWIGVHFGSRGLGHKTATFFLNAAGAKDGMEVDPCVLRADSDLGTDYLECMRVGGLYAYAGRDWVCDRVARILGAAILEEVHNHHNFAWRERHDGRDLWVVRKGATPAFPGQRGFVGGTMGEQSVILEGVESELSRQSLYSTVHGAGRVMGRMEAKGKVNKQGVVTREPKVTQSMMDNWVASAHVELRGAGVDEAPQCYKRLPEVLAEHAGMIRVLHTFTPIGVAMAGRDCFDPFKD